VIHASISFVLYNTTKVNCYWDIGYKLTAYSIIVIPGSSASMIALL